MLWITVCRSVEGVTAQRGKQTFTCRSHKIDQDITSGLPGRLCCLLTLGEFNQAFSPLFGSIILHFSLGASPTADVQVLCSIVLFAPLT